VWQRTLDGPGNTEMVFYDYDGSGRVLDRAKIDQPSTRDRISDDTYNSFFYNSGGEAIGNVPTSSFAATRKTLHGGEVHPRTDKNEGRIVAKHRASEMVTTVGSLTLAAAYSCLRSTNVYYCDCSNLK